MSKANINEILKAAIEKGASDIFIVAGLPVSVRVHGKIEQINDERMLPDDTKKIISQIYEFDNMRSFEKFEESGDDDFSFAVPGLSRFRVNAYKQRGSYSAVVRVIDFELPDPKTIGVIDSVINAANYSQGLVLVTGPAGSGKTTTLACMVDYINSNFDKHIITLEDPIEFLHRHKKSIVSQREVHSDTDNYVTALRASLRQSPDVILLGEMRDLETTKVAMTAAETGHLVLSTLHTIGAANTVDRIIDMFPPEQQRQIAIQLSMTLQAVITQRLVPSVEGKLIPVFEIMTVTPAVSNMIREKKIPQLEGLLYSSDNEGMRSMDTSLFNLFKEGKITRETALSYSTNPEMLKRKLG